jgi:hypothetical protein
VVVVVASVDVVVGSVVDVVVLDEELEDDEELDEDEDEDEEELDEDEDDDPASALGSAVPDVPARVPHAATSVANAAIKTIKREYLIAITDGPSHGHLEHL